MEKFQEQWSFSLIVQGAAPHIVHSANEQQGCQNENIQGTGNCPYHVSLHDGLFKRWTNYCMAISESSIRYEPVLQHGSKPQIELIHSSRLTQLRLDL
jgi:hypothetical protein